MNTILCIDGKKMLPVRLRIVNEDKGLEKRYNKKVTLNVKYRGQMFRSRARKRDSDRWKKTGVDTEAIFDH